MGPTCERCGADLPPDARFCARCGWPVAEVTQAGERRLVTMLFADIAGSTELTASLDAERAREVMTAFAAMASRELTSLRGRAEKYVGDAVMAVFGLPTANEDDALRAVRAGLRISEGTARLEKELGLPGPLRVRVGIATGDVAVGPGPSGQLFASGTAVNLAARLEEAAGPGEVLVGKATRELVRDRVEFGEARKVPAKGFHHEIEAVPVVGLTTRSSRRTIPLIGRARELRLLLDTFERVRETGRGHLFTVLGEPGIGKSRLADEVVARLAGDAMVLSGRAADLEDTDALSPLAQMIRGALGVDREAPAPTVAARLGEVVERCCPPSETDEVAAQLGLALGLGRDEPAERRYRIEEIRRGFVTFLRGSTTERPVVLVFEDLHIARDELLELIEAVARRVEGLPVLIVCLARDELLDRRPGWGGGLPASSTLRLEPLPLEEARELARAAGEALDETTAERIARKAGGNPFFIVETTGMLLSSGRRAGPWPASPLIPATVRAVVASRMDDLPPRARELMRRASVLPAAAFRTADLAVVGDPDPATLETLEEEEVLVRDPNDPEAFRFRHETLREVAYQTLAKRDRVRLHVRAADAIAGAEGRERAAAYHLEHAARASLDLDPTDRRLADRAVDALWRAADIARRRIESATAVDLSERALALAGPEAGWGEREARILSGMGEARYWLGAFEEAEETLERALAIPGRGDWTVAHASRFLADIVLNVHADPKRARALFDDALEASRRLGNPWAEARALLMMGWIPIWEGDRAEARRTFERALEIARTNREGDWWGEARALTSLASAISPDGEEAACLALAEEALALGVAHRDPFTEAVAHQYVGNSLRRMGRFDEALPHLDAAVSSFRDLGARWELASATGDRGTIHRLTGRTEDAERDLRRALSICRDLGEKTLTAWTVTELARTLIAAGELSEAEAVLGRAGLLEPGAGDELAWANGVRALLALRHGDREQAEELARTALRAAAETRAPNYAATWIWWVGKVVDPGLVGGDGEVERARARLEVTGWRQPFRETALTLEELGRGAG